MNIYIISLYVNICIAHQQQCSLHAGRVAHVREQHEGPGRDGAGLLRTDVASEYIYMRICSHIIW